MMTEDTPRRRPRSGTGRPSGARPSSSRSTADRRGAERPARGGASGRTGSKTGAGRPGRPEGARSQRSRSARSTRSQTRPGARRAPGARHGAPTLADQLAGLGRRILPPRVPLASARKRLQVALVTMALLIAVCGLRLLQVQGIDSKAYAATAAKQMTRSSPLPATRGSLTDRNGEVLASTAAAVLVTADPTLINSPDPKANHVQEVADLLVKHVGGERGEYLTALTRPDTKYSVVARKVPAAAYHRLASELSDRNIYGIFRESDPIRSYPEQTTAANVVGFVGADSKGQGGFEYSMNSELAGTPGQEMYEASPKGYRIPLGTNVLTPPTDGTSYQLTLDTELQQTAERRLAQTVRDSGAKSGMAITMNIKTGEVLAMANAPTFDPNNLSSASPEALTNLAVTKSYEPGSVQKLLTMAALMDKGLVDPQTRLVIPPSIKSGDGVVKDVWGHGYAKVTARGVVAHSSNIGTIMMTRQMETAAYREYLAKMGLGQPTGIELPGEAAGYLPPPDMPGYARDQVAFGQGLSVTAIQNASALSGILNGGVYNPPTIVRQATDAQGNPVPVKRQDSRRVVSEETSRNVASLMESVLKDGDKLDVPGYRVGVKTGTSENFDPALGKYNGFTSSYVAMAPAENPQILTYVVVEDPKNGHTGGGIAGPVASDVLTLALPRYGVQPSTGTGPSKKDQEWD